MEKIKWFCYLNDNPKMLDEYLNYYKVAVKTQQINAPSLIPHLVYDGNNEKVLNFCEKNNIIVIKHQSKIHDKVFEYYQKNKPHQVFDALACFLKPEVPLISKKILKYEDKYVLLTDSDVMFFNDPIELYNHKVSHIGVSSEFDINLSDFNAGIMWFNVDTMCNELDEFENFIVNNFDKFEVFDQDAFKQYYKTKTYKLPIEYNYKSYWGYARNKKEINILHFHGLKPKQYMEVLTGKNTNPVLKPMLTPTYIEMVGYYNAVLDLIEKI